MAETARNNRIIKKLKGTYASVGTAAWTFANKNVYAGSSTAYLTVCLENLKLMVCKITDVPLYLSVHQAIETHKQMEV
jgi:hypothetical protein